MPLDDVLRSLASEAPTRKKGEGPPKRYIMFEMDEWRDKVEKPLGGSAISPTQAKMIFCNMLAKLASGEWKLDTGK